MAPFSQMLEPPRNPEWFIAYAVWSGAGVVLVSLMGWMLYHQSLDAAALIGISLIVAGVLVLNLYSKAVVH